MPAEPPPLILAELVETRSRAGARMFIGRANGLRLTMFRAGTRTDAAGETV